MKILLVDDDDMILKVAQRAFRRHGIALETAIDGAEALAKLADTAFDAVISDFNMPRMKGDVLLRTVHDKYPTVQCLLHTSELFDTDMRVVTKCDFAKMFALLAI